MTREEILALPAGREMDELIARLVMGWREGEPGINAGAWVDEKGIEETWNCGPNRWRPSESVADAWRAVERSGLLDAAGPYLLCGWYEGGWVVQAVEQADDYYQTDDWSNVALGETMPLAVCRAMLLVRQFPPTKRAAARF